MLKGLVLDHPMVDWRCVETVLLDMDGTLLDLRFDNYFWRELVPAEFARTRKIDLDAACAVLFPRMQALRGTLDWYCVEFWSRELDLDIVALKNTLRHRIRVREGAREFLAAVRGSGRRQFLVTNAHERTLDIKLATTKLRPYFDKLVSAHGFGVPKEDQDFWLRLRRETGISPKSCLFIDDSEPVLCAARHFGIGQVIGVSNPDSGLPPAPHRDFSNLEAFSQLMPITAVSP